MKNWSFFILGYLLLLIVVSESGVISPKEDRSGDEEIPLPVNKLDDKLGLHPEGIWGPGQGGDDFGMYDFGIRGNDPNAPPDYDYELPGGGNSVNEADKDRPGTEKNPPVDEKPSKSADDIDDIDKKEGDGYTHEPFDGEENANRTDEDKDKKFPTDEKDGDGYNHEDGDKSDDTGDDEKKTSVDSDKKEDGDRDENEVPEEEEKKISNEEDEKNKHVPIDDEEKHDDDEEPEEEKSNEHDEDNKNIDGGEEAEFFHGNSIFNTPIFNLEQVKKYFSQLERALGHVFRQTLDEAVLLNGTYANTTEEEVEIDGKKYVVQKSVIQGADNHSSIYVEALSSKPKMNDTKEIPLHTEKKDTDVKNGTHI